MQKKGQNTYVNHEVCNVWMYGWNTKRTFDVWPDMPMCDGRLIQFPESITISFYQRFPYNFDNMLLPVQYIVTQHHLHGKKKNTQNPMNSSSPVLHFDENCNWWKHA